MATFYIDNTTPQPQVAPASSAGGNFLSGLSQLAEAKQRGRYYDYLADAQKQKIRQDEDNTQKAALAQDAANKILKKNFDNNYRNLASVRAELAKTIKLLDNTIGPNSNAQVNIIPEGFSVEQRIEMYDKYLNSSDARSKLQQRLLLPNANQDDLKINNSINRIIGDALNLKTISDKRKNILQDLTKEGSQVRMFRNENGVTDFEFVPRNDIIKYYSTRYGKDFQTGNPLDARSEAPAPAVEAEPQSLSEVARRQATLTSPEYVTNVGPAVGGPILPPVEPAQPVVTEPAPAALTQPPVVPAPAPQAMPMKAPAAIPVQQVAPTPAPAPAPVADVPQVLSEGMPYNDIIENIRQRGFDPYSGIGARMYEDMSRNRLSNMFQTEPTFLRGANSAMAPELVEYLNEYAPPPPVQVPISAFPGPREAVKKEYEFNPATNNVSVPVTYNPLDKLSVEDAARIVRQVERGDIPMPPFELQALRDILAAESSEFNPLRDRPERIFDRRSVESPPPLPVDQPAQLVPLNPVGAQGNTPMRLDQLSPLMNE